MPHAARAPACRKWDLPYAADPAITRHLARFLRQQAAPPSTSRFAAGQRSGLPHACSVQRRRAACAVRARTAARSAERLACAKKASRRSQPLAGEDLMHAVARGAAYYGSGAAWQRRAHSRRHSALLLCRNRIRHARRARHSRARQSAHRGAVRHGRRHRPRDSRPRIWPDRRSSPPSFASSAPRRARTMRRAR